MGFLFFSSSVLLSKVCDRFLLGEGDSGGVAFISVGVDGVDVFVVLSVLLLLREGDSRV